MLHNISLKLSYSKERGDDIAHEFYIPFVSSSIRYDRATGYFGSTIYIIAWSCLKSFVSNGGKMRIICSPYLVATDRKAISEGYDESAKERLLKEFEELFGKPTLSAPERVLACLIAKGVIDIRIAIGNDDPNRLFHDKIGILTDGQDVITFRGSMNETYKGLSDDGNFESIDVFKSWGDHSEQERCYEIQKEFIRIWNNDGSRVKSISLPNKILDLIESHARKIDNWTEALDETLVMIDERKSWSADKRPNGKRPRDHQLQALNNWEENGRRGIFEHATGSGKTFTAMCAMRKCMEEGCPVLVIVPSIGLMTQWKKEITETISNIEIAFLLCGTGHNSWKNNRSLYFYTKPDQKKATVVIAVADTAASQEFVDLICKSNKLLVIGDEVHSLGSERRRNVFLINAPYRLGLSATPKRYNDPVGTNAIISYFGKILEPKYSLKEAIDDDVLSRYFYYPQVVRLSADEQEQWTTISREISAKIARHRDDSSWCIQGDPYLQMLLIKRARIVKRATGKITLALRTLQNYYKEGQRWIIYCDDKEQMISVRSELEKVTRKCLLYHSEMSDSEKEATLKFFSEVGGVIVSIKCLDEGIDIPETSHALILASSQNPREYIQRRGRILRKSKKKRIAYLYDAIVVPDNLIETDNNTKIVETEINRAIQFGLWSEDKSCIYKLQKIAIENGIDYNEVLNYGIEYE